MILSKVRGRTIAAGLIAVLVATGIQGLVTTPRASATSYTHPTTINRDCPIYENFPKAGVPWRGWIKYRLTSGGQPYHVGVRYTYKGFAMVLDYSRANHHQYPRWGFMQQDCLTDPYAYSHGATATVFPTCVPSAVTGRSRSFT